MIRDGSTYDVIVDTVAVNDNNFHHAVLRHKNGNMSLYVDGVRHSASQTVTTPYTNSAPVLIGKWGGAGFNGIIDSVKIYNYALSDKQINNNYLRNQKLSYLETGSGETWNYNVVASNGSSYVMSRYKFGTGSEGGSGGSSSPNGTLNLVYDANGNLITGDGVYRVYNSLNQLWKVYNGSSTSGRLLLQFAYHPTEERVYYKTKYFATGENETTIYISDNFVRVINASGTFDYTYVFQEGQQVAQLLPNGQKQFIHGNHEGSSSVLTNSSGGVVERTDYTPFGEISSGGSKTRFDYENKEFDTSLDSFDFHFRQYKPEWGLFTQPDSLIQNVYDPQSLNRYMFERGNPYGKIDEDGHRASSAPSFGTSYPSPNPIYMQQYYQNVRVVEASWVIDEKDKRYWPSVIEHADTVRDRVLNADTANPAAVVRIDITFEKESDPYYHGECGTCTNYYPSNSFNEGSSYMGNVMNADYRRQMPSFTNSNNKLFTLIYSDTKSSFLYSNVNRGRRGSYSSSSGRVNFNIDEDNDGNAVGGSFGNWQMSSGFAKKLKEALDSLK